MTFPKSLVLHGKDIVVKIATEFVVEIAMHLLKNVVHFLLPNYLNVFMSLLCRKYYYFYIVK